MESIIFDKIVSKGINKRTCEDLADTISNVFWVIDGATLPKSLQKSEFTTEWLILTFNDNLKNEICENPSIKLSIALKRAIFSTKKKISHSFFQSFIAPSATIGMVRINENSIEYLILGDCTIVLQVDDKLYTLSDNRLNDYASVERETALNLIKTGQGFSNRHYKKKMFELVKEERKYMNQTNGYWVISTSPNAADHVLYNSIDTYKYFDIILYTDGFGRLVNEYGTFGNHQELITYVKNNGLKSAVSILRSIESNDRNGFKKARISFSDDATCMFLKKNN